MRNDGSETEEKVDVIVKRLLSVDHYETYTYSQDGSYGDTVGHRDSSIPETH